MNSGLQYPIFGPEIDCPHCHHIIPALTLTDTYLCSRHGPFEANPDTGELVHLSSSSERWRRWEGKWYRQHIHADGIRYEIKDAIDRLYHEGYRTTKVIIAHRYKALILSRSSFWNVNSQSQSLRLHGLPIEFSTKQLDNSCWEVINFKLEKQPVIPKQAIDEPG